ncbi:MAG TPA: hypothetical protein VMI54_16315 [Polyangiaceae bacterium]|nr:hypothetical protein [Polyangiaceae bacterium]
MIHSKLAPFIALAFAALPACGTPPGNEAEAETATSADALARNALTPAEEKTALALIDGICGDTWCDGDYDFRFDALRCGTASRSCALTLEILPREGVASAKGDYHRTCLTGDFDGFASLVDTAPSGYQSLDQDYYFALTDCISTLEANLPPAPGPCASTAPSAKAP